MEEACQRRRKLPLHNVPPKPVCTQRLWSADGKEPIQQGGALACRGFVREERTVRGVTCEGSVRGAYDLRSVSFSRDARRARRASVLALFPRASPAHIESGFLGEEAAAPRPHAAAAAAAIVVVVVARRAYFALYQRLSSPCRFSGGNAVRQRRDGRGSSLLLFSLWWRIQFTSAR